MSNKPSQAKPSQAKPSHSNVIRFSALAISITTLSGCGGGGDSSGSPTNGAPTTPIQCTAAQYLDTASNICISKASQQISGLNLPALSVGSQAVLNATASSGLAISYLSQTPSICIVNVSQVTALAAGICVIRAIQAGDMKTLPASQVATTEVTGSGCSSLQYLDAVSGTCQPKASQVITGFSLPALSVGDFAMLNARASSGLPISYNSVTPNICTVQTALNQVSAIAVGQCLIAAAQIGDTKTLPAQQVAATIEVTASVAPTKLLSATGITTCGDANNNGLSCNPLTSLRQDGEVQAGQKMSYRLLKQNSEDCVKDNATGLFWEQKTDNVRSIRHKDWKYQKSNGPFGVACGALTQCDTTSYLKKLNADNYCGYSDWRLPTRTELLGLVDYGRFSPSINPMFTHTSSGSFGSSGTMQVNFDTGSGSSDSFFHIRAVRSDR